MHQFYRLFPQIEITHQHDALIMGSIITPQVDAQIDILPVFCIPWGHQKLLIDRCKGDSSKAMFYVHKTIKQ